MLCRNFLFNLIQGCRVEISLPTLFADLSNDVLHDEETPLEPMGFPYLLLSRFRITEFAFHT